MATSEELENFEDNFETTQNNEIFPTINRNRIRTSQSLFDLVLEDVPSEKTQKTVYEDHLHKETCEWNELLKSKKSEVMKVESNSVTSDESVLSPEQLAFIKRGPDLAKFRDDSAAFCRKSAAYLEQHSNLVQMHSQLTELYKSHLDNFAFDIVYDCLYTRPKIKF